MKSALSPADFTFEYHASALPIGDNLGEVGDWINGIKIWVPVAGGLTSAQMGAGAQEVRVTFKGVEDFAKSETVSGNINVKKGTLSIKVKSASVTVAQGAPADMVTVSDPSVDYVTFYAGATSDIAVSFHLVMPNTLLSNENVLKVIDPILETITGNSFSKMMENGISLKELTSIASNETLLNALKLLGYDTEILNQVLNLVKGVSNVTPDVRIAFAAPKDAGLYNVTAISVNDNYNMAMGMGTLLVKQNTSGTKLAWNASISKPLTLTEAKSFDFGAAITSGGTRVEEKNVRYLYTGLTKRFRLYSSSKAPTEAGSYIVTAYVIGGDNFAMPVTRTFRIVAG